MSTQDFNALDNAGKIAMLAALRELIPGMPVVDPEHFSKSFKSAMQAGANACEIEWACLEAVYSENSQLYSGEFVEVPSGSSIFPPMIDEVLRARWYEGNEFDTTEIRLKRSDAITDFTLRPFKEAFFGVLTLLKDDTSAEAEFLKDLCNQAIAQQAKANADKTGDSSTIGGHLDSSSVSYELEKSTETVASFMNSPFTNDQLADYLTQKATENQLALYPNGLGLSNIQLEAFQVASALSHMAFSFEEHFVD